MNFFNSAPKLKFTRLHARIVQEDGAFTVRVRMLNHLKQDEYAWGQEIAATIDMASSMIGLLASSFAFRKSASPSRSSWISSKRVRSIERRSLDRAGRSEPGNVGRGISELLQNLVGVFAILRRAAHQAARRAAERERLPDQIDLAERRRTDTLRDLKMANLRIGEGLVDRIDRAARNARFVEQVDQRAACHGPGDLADDAIESVAVACADPSASHSRDAR